MRPALKITLLREIFTLVVLSIALGACKPATQSLLHSGTPGAVPSALATQTSNTPPPTPSNLALPIVTNTSDAMPSTPPTPSPPASPSSTDAPSPTAIPVPAGWKLVWHDEFDGAAGNKPDPAYWTYDLGAGGWGNDELQYYTDRAENASLDGKGSLVIKAIQFADPKASGLGCATCLYSSARLVTRGLNNFTYGMIEARMRLPSGQGLWPAFWLLGANIDQVGWPQSGEIDVMENKGSLPGVVRGSLHGPGYAGSSAFSQVYYLPRGKFPDDFHVFTVEWNAAEIRWYVDGQQYYSVAKSDLSGRWVFDHPFYLILNLAVGGTFAGPPGRSTDFPQSLRVDYVRVYQK